MNPHTELQAKEKSLREDLVNVQDAVLNFNRQEATLRAHRTKVEGLQKEAAIERHKIVVAIRERSDRLAARQPVGEPDTGAVGLYQQLETLDHARASLRATEQQLDKKIVELDTKRRPYVESQQRLLEQIDQSLAAQHDLHLNKPAQRQETDPMKGPDEFRRASAKKPAPQQAKKPLASVQRLEQLKKRLNKPKPSPELTPPGMTPNLAKRVKSNKTIGDEIVRIQKALNARRGKARDGFKRSSGG